jgi:predicted HAD superfamily Cof-like phosphohydrolase
MKNQIKQVEEFRKAFNLPINTNKTTLKASEYGLIYTLIKEELDEFMDASNDSDIVEIADALGDMLYLIYGAILHHGLQDKIVDVFDEIQKSNMSKLDEEGNPIINGKKGVNDMTKPLGKVLKSKNYFQPDIKNILES